MKKMIDKAAVMEAVQVLHETGIIDGVDAAAVRMAIDGIPEVECEDELEIESGKCV